MTGDAAAGDDAGAPYGRAFLCPRWELRITERCLREDLDQAAETSFEEAAGHPIVGAFAKKRLTSTGEGKTVGPAADADTLHHLGSGDRHRGATWWDDEHKVVWLCAYGYHESGAPDDAFQLFDRLIDGARIKPTQADFDALLDDRADRLANLLPESAAKLLEEARATPGEERQMRVGGLRLSIVVKVYETLEEVYVAVLGGTAREDKALRISLFTEAYFGEWSLVDRLPTRDLDDAEYEVCHHILHGDA